MWAKGGQSTCSGLDKVAFNRGLVCRVMLHSRWNITTRASHTSCGIFEVMLTLRYAHIGRNCCCSNRTLTERWKNCRFSAKSCSRSLSRFPKTSRRSVANHLELFIHTFRSVCVTFVFQSQDMVSTLEGALHTLQTEHDALKLKQEKVWL